ncbi:MAG: hypothetical protein ABS904_00480 [Solibacillus isronensis]
MRTFDLKEEITLTDKQLKLYNWLSMQSISKLKEQTLFDISVTWAQGYYAKGQEPPTDEEVAFVCAIIEYVYEFKFRNIVIGAQANRMMQQKRNDFYAMLV